MPPFASSHPVSGTLFPLFFFLFHCTDFKLLSSLCNLSSPRLSSSSFRVSSPSWFPSASLLLLVLLLLPTTRSPTNGCLLPFRSSTRCSDTVWTRWLRFHADVVFFPLHARGATLTHNNRNGTNNNNNTKNSRTLTDDAAPCLTLLLLPHKTFSLALLRSTIKKCSERLSSVFYLLFSYLTLALALHTHLQQQQHHRNSH